MSAAVALAGVVVPLGVVVVLAPPGSGARRELRRARPELRRRPGPRFRSPRSHRREGTAAHPWAPAGHALEAGGRRLRSLAHRPPDPAADRAVGGAAVAAAVVAVVFSPVVAVTVGLATWAAPVLRARGRRRRRESAVRAALPDTVDLFRLSVGAGLSLHQAVDAVARRAPVAVVPTLEEVRRQVALGVRLGDALDALDALGDPALPLAAALRGAARYGAPLAEALERVGADARLLRRRTAEERARRLPVQLLFPLVLCVLPAFGLLAVVPLLLASLRSLQL